MFNPVFNTGRLCFIYNENQKIFILIVFETWFRFNENSTFPLPKNFSSPDMTSETGAGSKIEFSGICIETGCYSK